MPPTQSLKNSLHRLHPLPSATATATPTISLIFFFFSCVIPFNGHCFWYSISCPPSWVVTNPGRSSSSAQVQQAWPQQHLSAELLGVFVSLTRISIATNQQTRYTMLSCTPVNNLIDFAHCPDRRFGTASSTTSLSSRQPSAISTKFMSEMDKLVSNSLTTLGILTEERSWWLRQGLWILCQIFRGIEISLDMACRLTLFPTLFERGSMSWHEVFQCSRPHIRGSREKRKADRRPGTGLNQRRRTSFDGLPPCAE